MKNDFTNDLSSIKAMGLNTEIFKYDERGNLIQLSNDDFTKVMEYDNYNNVISNIYKYSNGDTQSCDIENIYDDNGILRTQKITSKDTDYKDLYKYDEKGRLVFQGIDETNPDWTTNINYDDENNKVVTTMPSLYNYKKEKINYNINDNQFMKILNKRDDIDRNTKAGFEIRINNTNRDTVSEYHTSLNNTIIVEQEYDSDNRLIKESEYHLKKEEYIDHDSNNNIINIETYDVDNNCSSFKENDNLERNMVSSLKRELEYDDQNRIVTSTVIQQIPENIPTSGWYKDDSITNLFDSYNNRFK